MVTAYPEVRKVELQKEDEFIVLACDGIWDVLSSQACVEFIRQKIATGMSLKAVCEALCDRRVRREVNLPHTTPNHTVDSQAPLSFGWGAFRNMD